MEVIGIIAEYNPFHNGHMYHINKIKELYSDSLIICVTSSCFTERGDVCIINKWNKTNIMLDNSIDIVIELPYSFSSQSADIFAKGALKILNELEVNKIIFGSELNDVSKLYEIASITINNKNYDLLVSKYMSEGNNYPTSCALATKKITGFNINTPNDTLGLCYIKEILINNYDIAAHSIQRTNNYNSTKVTGGISSASSIRECLKNGNRIDNYVPDKVINLIYDLKNIENNYFNLLKYKIVSEHDLSIFQTVDEGIENKILKNIEKCSNLEELINNVKSKRYTYNKLKRMFTHILVGFTKSDAIKFKDISYIRILGFSTNGRIYLNKIKKKIELPLVTNYINNDMLNFEKRVTDIYSLIVNDSLLSELEYKNKPIQR